MRDQQRNITDHAARLVAAYPGPLDRGYLAACRRLNRRLDASAVVVNVQTGYKVRKSFLEAIRTK